MYCTAVFNRYRVAEVVKRSLWIKEKSDHAYGSKKQNHENPDSLNIIIPEHVCRGSGLCNSIDGPNN